MNNPNQCERIVTRKRSGRAVIRRQCTGENGFGPGGFLCGNHAAHDELKQVQGTQRRLRQTQRIRTAQPDRFQDDDITSLGVYIGWAKTRPRGRGTFNMGIAEAKRRIANLRSLGQS